MILIDRNLRYCPPAWWTTIALLLSLPSYANESSQHAMSVIDRMSQAGRTLNFDGFFVYRRGNNIDSMRIIHKAENGKELERLISLTGPAREIIRNDRETTCIFADNRAVVVSKHQPREFFPSSLPEPINKVADLYSFVVLGQERIAGRPSWMIRIDPKDPDRYGYQLWIDTESYLLLRSNVLGRDGDILEQVLFTNIELRDHIPDAMLKPTINGRDYALYSGESQPSDISMTEKGQPQWRVEWLPVGFAMRDREMHAMDRSRKPVDHMIFSDGVATISVFVEELDKANDRLEGYTSLGAVNTYSTLANDHQVTVVGELPPVTVRRIATSVSQPLLSSQ